MGMARFSKDYKGAGYVLVDNLFVTEYMEQCDEKALKVYLYGLFALQSGNDSLNTVQRFCQELKLTEDDVFSAYEFFEELGLVELISRTPPDIKYIPLSGVYGKPRKVKPGKYAEFTKQVQTLLPDRMVTTNEYNEYFNLIETYTMEPEALIMAIKYCTLIKNNNINYKYIITVAKSWIDRGITTLSAAETELYTYNKQSGEINEILKAMGYRGGTDYSDTALYTKWVDQMGFCMDAIMFSARQLKQKKGTMQKLDQMLTEFFKHKKLSVKEISDYVEEKQKYKDTTYAVLREIGQYIPVIDPVIETYILPWTDKGYNERTLTQIASYCFKAGFKTLESMDKFISKLHKLGLITLESINEFIELQYTTEKTTQKILETAGLNRQVNTYDRTNYHLWSATWGLPDSLIMYAAEICKEYFNPLKNLHNLLSYYKNNNIFNVEKASTIPPKNVLNGGTRNQIENKNDFIKRDYSKEELSAMFINVEDFEV